MDMYIHKLIKEQFNIANMDFNKNLKHNYNIFNKNTVDIEKIFEDILNDDDVREKDIKELNNYISVIKVKTKNQLKKIVNWYSNNYPNESMNWLDVSEITDMSDLFSAIGYNGDISQWDVSNVTNMNGMFGWSSFNGDISQWDVSNVEYMDYMFADSVFNGDISGWDVSNVNYFKDIFKNSALNKEKCPAELLNDYNYIYN